MMEAFNLRFLESDSDDIFGFYPEDSNYNNTVPLKHFSCSPDVNPCFGKKDSFKIRAEEEDTGSSATDNKEESKDADHRFNTASLFSEDSVEAEINDDVPEESRFQEISYIQVQSSEMKESDINSISGMSGESIPQKLEKNEKKKKKKNGEDYKSDAIKNMWVSVWKITIKAFHTPSYKKIAERMCCKCNTSYAQVSKFYKPKMSELISLQNLRQYLDYKQEGSLEDPIRKAFNQFYVWFIHNRYTLHVVRSDDIQHKDIYLKGKNKLIYLPNIKIDPKSRRIKKNSRGSIQSQ